MSHPLDAIARDIFRKAEQFSRWGEVIECLMDGGSVTVDHVTGELVLIDDKAIAKLAGGRVSALEASRAGERQFPAHDLERLRAANGRLLEMLHGMCVLNDFEAVEVMEFVNSEWRPK